MVDFVVFLAKCVGDVLKIEIIKGVNGYTFVIVGIIGLAITILVKAVTGGDKE